MRNQFSCEINCDRITFASFWLLRRFNQLYPLPGRTRFRGKLWAAIQLCHHPRLSCPAINEEVDGLDIRERHGRQFILLRHTHRSHKVPYLIRASRSGKPRAAIAQSFTLWQQATIEITCHDHSHIACSCHIYMGAIRRAHPVRESHIQSNVNVEVATTSLFLQRTTPIDVLFATFTSWS